MSMVASALWASGWIKAGKHLAVCDSIVLEWKHKCLFAAMFQPERSMRQAGCLCFCWGSFCISNVHLYFLWFSSLPCNPTFSCPGRNTKFLLKLNLCHSRFLIQQLICFQVNEPKLFMVREGSVYCEWIINKEELIKSKPGFNSQITTSAARLSLFGCLLAVFPAAVSAIRVVIKLTNRVSVNHNPLRVWQFQAQNGAICLH